MSPEEYNIGVLTDGDIGTNLTYRLASSGYTPTIFNTNIINMERSRGQRYVSELERMGIDTCLDYDSFFLSLKENRVIFIISNNQLFSKEILKEIDKHLDSTDIIIDMCDCNYDVATKRCDAYKSRGVSYMATGFSGGEYAALHGASLMPGGSLETYNNIRPLFEALSAKYGTTPCCDYIGPDGSGMYVKMIHNGIEYVMMQVICEVIGALKKLLGYGQEDICDILREWETGDTDSYLIDLSRYIYSKIDAHTNKPIVDITSDKVEYSQSVKWLCASALDLSVPVPTIHASIEQRFFSGMKNERIGASNLFKTPIIPVREVERDSFIEMARAAYCVTGLCAYMEGFALLSRANEVYMWKMNLNSIAQMLEGSSFIKSRLLRHVIDAYGKSEKGSSNLLKKSGYGATVNRYLPHARIFANICIESGIAMPALLSALTYIDTYRLSPMPSGLISLIRDHIENTGYVRNDEMLGVYTADWENPDDIIKSFKK
ncbi:MAG: hypothetical protein E7385_06040 [Ruminococcaceae bacterium]|nr:hypothetical protein [Oscillospiraceae bacterium]